DSFLLDLLPSDTPGGTFNVQRQSEKRPGQYAEALPKPDAIADDATTANEESPQSDIDSNGLVDSMKNKSPAEAWRVLKGLDDAALDRYLDRSASVADGIKAQAENRDLLQDDGTVPFVRNAEERLKQRLRPMHADEHQAAQQQAGKTNQAVANANEALRMQKETRRRAALVESFAGRENLRHSPSRRVQFDYDVDSVGSQGVAAVELWLTRDGGDNWVRGGEDADKTSPFDVATSSDGLYGFRIVVVGGNGLASRRPMSGEDADLYVLIDTTKPDVKIRGAAYGTGDATGSLVIQYDAEDRNLKEQAIALLYSDSINGPWRPIATRQTNSGQYQWPADPRLPRRIYLRVEATDQAGNVGSATLQRPIDVQGLAPKARIRGFRSIN
ncbi:MAG: hypothetical protein AAFP69_02840, partial [Planctomycetota bacterium]